jgi:hypothetical protein
VKIDTEAQVRRAESTLRLAWVIVFGAVLFSVLTVTPLVRRVTPDAWDWTAPILPIVVDVAVVIVVRVDAIIAVLGGRPGSWGAVLRWITGLFTLALNIGNSALTGDLVGVGVHLVAPTLLILTAEASLTYRQAITAAVERIAADRAAAHERSRVEQQAREERERAERKEREDAEERRRERERDEREKAREQAAHAAREEREHAAREAREQREFAARTERERAERDEAARQAQAAREQEARDREQARVTREREHAAARQRAERERQETADRAERERVEQEREQVRAQLASAREQDAGPREQLLEPQARRVVAIGLTEGATQRQMVTATGWSAGWVAKVVKELRDDQPMAGQTEIPVSAAA